MNLKRLIRDTRGSVSTICVLTSLPFIAVAGMAIDFHRGSNTHSELQQIADAAALAAAAPMGISQDARKKIALQYIDANSQTVDITEKSVVVGPNTVDVSVGAMVEGSLTRVLTDDRHASESTQSDGPSASDLDVNASTKAAFGRDSYVCLLSLNPKDFESVRFYGNSDFMAKVCTVHANSNNLTAMRTMGSAYAEAEDFCAVGGWSGSGFEPNPTGGCNVKKDPYAGLELPTAGACKSPNPSPIKNKTVTLTQGTYCGGLDIGVHAVVTMQPGIYIIKDGAFKMDSHSSLVANGVTIFLTGSSSLSISSGASVTFKAPTTGALAGMAIIQAANSSPGITNVISSGGDVNITGAYYTPTQNLQVWANGDMNTASPYFPIVVDKFEMSGNATLYVKLDWKAAGLPEPTMLKQPSYVLLSQ